MTRNEIIDFNDRFPREYYYGVYCMIDVLKGHGVMDIYEANNDAWDEGEMKYQMFLESKYNSYDKSEMDCMNEYVEYEVIPNLKS